MNNDSLSSSLPFNIFTFEMTGFVFDFFTLTNCNFEIFSIFIFYSKIAISVPIKSLLGTYSILFSLNELFEGCVAIKKSNTSTSTN